MELWITLHAAPGDGIAPPAVCPHAACGGTRLRLWQVVAKPFRGVAERDGWDAAASAPRATLAHRYRCLDCGRTIRVYPDGIDRGRVPAGVKRFAAALYVLGLTCRDVSRALWVLGAPMGKTHVNAVVAATRRDRQLEAPGDLAPAPGNWVGGALTRLGAARGRRGVVPMGDDEQDVVLDPLLARVGLNVDSPAARIGTWAADCLRGTGAAGAKRALLALDPATAPGWAEVGGRRLPLWRAADNDGRPALVVDGVDHHTRWSVERWARGAAAVFGVAVEIVTDADRERQHARVPRRRQPLRG